MNTHENDTQLSNGASELVGFRTGGVPANVVFIPIVVVLVIMHALIIALIFGINTESSKLSQTMQESSAYVTDATSLLAGSSLLCETSMNYVLVPQTPQGEPNVEPLIPYANELAETDHRGNQVAARFETYNVSEEVLQKIEDAAHSANELISVQLHALALMNAVYSFSDHPALSSLTLPELSAEEAALSNDEKVELAQALLLDPGYSENKHSVSSNVNGAVGIIRGTSGALAQSYGQSVSLLRTLMWVVTIAIIMALCASLTVIYRMFISPLGKYSHLIANDQRLDAESGLREMRILADSYNKLLHRHDALEGILREAAETDTLTGLPNRYSLEQHILDSEGKSHSLAVFEFDVDYLKRTNDTLGHAAGDDLIRRAAECISTCFATTENGRCYRLGGDEFAATVKNVREDELAEMIQEFEQSQKRYDVSISWGYAYTEDIGSTSFKALMDEADSRMYLRKEKNHRASLHAARTGSRASRINRH